jgi:Protein of unknown function DUF262/Protein of unknown function (DUF1524)
MSNAPIRTIETTLSDFLHTPDTQLRIPIYQRPFTWGKKGDKKCNDKLRGFIDVLTELSVAPDSLKFFGFIVTYPEGKPGLRQRKFFNIIDGQQRLTSMSLTLLCLSRRLSDLIQELQTISEQQEDVELKKILDMASKLQSEIYENYIIFHSSVTKGEAITDSALRLRTGRRDLASYLRLVNGEVPLSGDESSISNGYHIINSLLTKDERSSSKYPSFSERFDFVELIYSALRRLHIATLEVQDPALGVNSIFESINFKGEKLSDFDLIRNFIIEFYENQDASEEMFIGRWEKMEILYREVFGDDSYETELGNAIFSHLRYVLPKTEKVSRKDIYETFARVYAGASRDRKVNDANISTVIDHAVVYLRLLKPEANLGTVEPLVTPSVLNRVRFDADTVTALQILAKRRLSVPIPFMMAVILNPKGASKNVVAEAANKVTSFFVRHELSGGTTKSLLQPFINLKADYIEAPSSDISNFSLWFSDNLTQKAKNGRLVKMYPDDRSIIDYLKKTEDVYEEHYDVIKFTLFEINKFVMGDGFDAELCKDYELDHIMPQTPNAEWETSLYSYHKEDKKQFAKYVNQLGNLTLVRKPLNAMLSNDSYPLRCAEYRTVAVLLTSELPTKYPRWHFEKIAERTKYLTDLILKRFV